MKLAASPEAIRLAKKITPRLARLMAELSIGPVTRKQADFLTGATNSPHLIAVLRHKFRLPIDTERVEGLDRDGQPTWMGVYYMDDDTRWTTKTLLKLREFLARESSEQD